MEHRQENRFRIEKLEERIAPAPNAAVIPSTDATDPGVNGAEHACPGLSTAVNNPHQAAQLARHGSIAGVVC